MRLMLWLFFAKTAGTPNSAATMAAMPMPLASMVSILFTGASAKSSCHWRAISWNRPTSIWWLMKESTFRTSPSTTMPSRLMRSSRSLMSDHPSSPV